MALPTLSLVLLGSSTERHLSDDLSRLAGALRSTGLTHETIIMTDGEPSEALDFVRQRALYDPFLRVVTAGNGLPGAAIRRGVQEARGDIIVICPLEAPFRMRDVEYAIAMVHSGATDVAVGMLDSARGFGDSAAMLPRGRFVRRATRLILGAGTIERMCDFRVMHANAAKLLYAEAKLNNNNVHYEVLYLASRYGFRVDYLPIAMISPSGSIEIPCDWSTVGDALRIRRFSSQQMYRTPRRCPICFSQDVFTVDQMNGHVVRHCRRCKCRYLSEFPSDDQLEKVIDQRVARQIELEPELAPEAIEAGTKTAQKRLKEMRKLIAPQSRLLEVGARRGDVGAFLSREFQYVGIELSDRAARAARTKGLEVYRASIPDFVNVSGLFDAVLLLDVMQHISRPHDALDRIRDNLKTGGYLVIITPDTESLTSVFSGRRWVAHKIPEHLVLYSRSALVELLERTGFDIVSATSDYQYIDHDRIRRGLHLWPGIVRGVVQAALTVLPNPLLVSRGSIRIVAKRRSGVPFAARPIHSVEATHAQ